MDSDDALQDLNALDDLTNDRRLAENGLLPGIDAHELVFAVPCHQIINAAFTHAHPLGSRFNGPNRGAWYAAFALKTSQQEVAYHRALDLSEIDYYHDDATYDDYLADFSAQFHDIRENGRFSKCLDPRSYKASQKLAEETFEAGSLGVVYPSIRHTGGTCIACFRPALVGNVRKDRTYRFVWTGDPTPTVTGI
ncbi:MAG TPA: RES family NAD+ phosphorylase [Candidatus Baltobacteraceae bacterium]|nr:RES family NAD+ phosphorylase [Candidatus Baltobacteraceae bacterium]